MQDTSQNKELNDNVILEDDVVRLTVMQEDDYAHLLPFALQEPNLWEYSLVNPAGEDGLKYYMQLALDAKTTGAELPFAVFDKRTNEYAGSTRFYDINQPYQTLQIGYTWYGKKFHGTGLNKHCKFLLLQYVFETLHFERAEFRADAMNERSIAAMKSIGCKVDGILRANMPKRQGGRRDSIVLSILKEEWFDGVKERLKERL